MEREIKFIVKYIEKRKPYVEEMKKQLPDLELVKGNKYEDIPKDVINTFREGLKRAENKPTLQMQDDIILCDNFKEKVLKEISKRPDDVIQFFSMRKKDLEVGSRYENPSNFIALLCVYFPEGMAKELLEYSYKWGKFKENPSADDFIVRDFLTEKKKKYYIVVPNLVEHRKIKSSINPKRPPRTSKTFRGVTKIKIEQIPVNKVKPYWKNPRKNHDIEGIKKSIEEFGLNSPIVIDKNNVIIVGHGRYKALIQLGWKEIPCIVKEMSQKKAKEYRIIDNKLNENSQWEKEFLRQELMDIEEPIGFNFKELQDFRDMEYTPENFDSDKTDIERWKENKHEKIKLTCPHCLEEYEVNKNDILKSE